MSRISHETGRVRRGKRSAEPNLIAGLIPAADGPMARDMADALRERAHLIEDRALALAESAVDTDARMAQAARPGTRRTTLSGSGGCVRSRLSPPTATATESLLEPRSARNPRRLPNAATPVELNKPSAGRGPSRRPEAAELDHRRVVRPGASIA